MSQFPSPYQPPAYPPAPPMDFSQYTPYGMPDLLAPARRASVLQGILAGLMLACGACVGAIVWKVDLNEMFARANINPAQFTRGGSVESLRTGYIVFSVMVAVVGLTMLALSFPVNKGRFAAIVISVVLSTLVLILLGLNVIGSILFSGGNMPAAVMSMVMLSVPIALFALNVVWLVGAARNASAVKMAQQQYQAQFYQMQQQQYAYGPGGPYGIPQPPMPPQGYGHASPAPPAQPGSRDSQAPPPPPGG